MIFRSTLAVLALLIAVTASASAQTYTWNRTTDGNWNDADSWLDELLNPAVPASGTTTALVFGATGSTSYTATNDIGAFTLNSLSFNNAGTGLITVAGGTITLGGTTPTINVSAGSATIQSVLAGTSAITKAGAGTLILSGASTFTGGLVLSAGTLVYASNPVTSSSTAGFATGTITSSPFGTGALTLSGGTLTIDGSDRVMRNTMTVVGTESVIHVGSGREFTTTNTITGGLSTTITKTGSGLWRIADAGNASNTGNFTGTIIINGGTVLLTDPTSPAIGGDISSQAIIVNDTGKFVFGSTPVFSGENPDLPGGTIITVNTGGIAEFNIGEDYGGIRLQGGAYNSRVNNNLELTSILESGSIGPLEGTNGSFGGAGQFRKTTAGTVTNTAFFNNTGGLAIEEGVFSTSAGFGGATGNISFGTDSTAGTLKYTGTVSGLIARPVVVNATGGTIDIVDGSTTVTLTGAISGTGPLTKTGAGTLALAGAIGHSGLTTISQGRVVVTPVAASGGFVVANGATLAVNSGAGTASFTTPTLSLGSTASLLQFDLTGNSLPTAPLLVVSAADGLALNGGTHTLGLANPAGIPTGTITLIDYTGAPITSGFNLALPGRTAGSLNYDTANTRIEAIITGTDTIKWTGAVNGTWDVGSAANVGGTNNWQLVNGGIATNFIQTDIVTFDDSASLFTVDLGTTVLPSSVTVNTSGTYTIQGAGKISGSAGLTKLGSGTLILATDNDYTGGTTVPAGILQIGNGGATGSIGTGNLVATGDVIFNRSSDLIYSGSISGSSTITKTGAGMLTLDGDNTFNGTVIINGGTLRLADNGLGGDLDASSIVINNGGRFEFFGPAGNADLPGGTIITINSGGVAEFTEAEDYGAIRLQGGAYNTGVNNNLGLESIFESGTLGNVAGVNGSLAGGGLIRKTTAGTVTITGVALNNTGGLAIEEGVLSTDSAIGGSGELSLGLNGNSTLRYRGTSATVNRPVTLGEGGGTIEVTEAGTQYTFSGIVGGIGAFNKSGPGTLIFTGNNEYSASTTISGGTLRVTGQTGTNSGTGTSPVTVASGGTLDGTGRVAGTVTVSDGGKLAAGVAGAGTLSVANNVIINGGGRFAAGLAASGTSSRLVAEGSSSTIDLKNGSILDLTQLSGFNSATAATYTVLSMPTGRGANVLLNGAATTDGQVLGSYTQGSGASGPVTISLTGFSLAAGDSFVLTRSGDGLVLSFSPVPEPATVLAIAAATLGLGRMFRRRFRAVGADRIS